MLNRLALRLAAIEALAPHAKPADEPWPTIAGAQVLDSQIVAIDVSRDGSRQPAIGVFTDETDTKPYGTDPDAGFDAECVVCLCFEIVVPLATPAIGTDSLAEAFLDICETQIRAALAKSRMAGALSAVLIEIRDVSSQPWRDADTETRLSARRVEMNCRVRSEGDLPGAEADGLDRLPTPLREVAALLPEGSDGRAVCAAIASAIPSAPEFPPLDDIRLAFSLAREEGCAPPPDAGDVQSQVTFP